MQFNFSNNYIFHYCIEDFGLDAHFSLLWINKPIITITDIIKSKMSIYYKYLFIARNCKLTVKENDIVFTQLASLVMQHIIKNKNITLKDKELMHNIEDYIDPVNKSKGGNATVVHCKSVFNHFTVDNTLEYKIEEHLLYSIKAIKKKYKNINKRERSRYEQKRLQYSFGKLQEIRSENTSSVEIY